MSDFSPTPPNERASSVPRIRSRNEFGPANPGKFTGPVTLGLPTLDTILRMLGVADKPEAEQRAAVRAAVAGGRLYPLQLTALREAGWLQPED